MSGKQQTEPQPIPDSQLPALYDRLKAKSDEQEREIEALRKRVKAADELAVDIGKTNLGWEYCVVCEAGEGTHTKDCKLAAYLATAEKGT